jgi:hypothetical protein
LIKRGAAGPRLLSKTIDDIDLEGAPVPGLRADFLRRQAPPVIRDEAERPAADLGCPSRR